MNSNRDGEKNKSNQLYQHYLLISIKKLSYLKASKPQELAGAFGTRQYIYYVPVCNKSKKKTTIYLTSNESSFYYFGVLSVG